jgi:hypothetical protein
LSPTSARGRYGTTTSCPTPASILPSPESVGKATEGTFDHPRKTSPHAAIRWSCHFSSWDTDGMAASRDKLVVTPLTARLWPTFVDLLDEGGPASRCWCMAPRIGASWRRQSPRQNRDAFQDIVEEGPPPGLLALERKTAVGWCQLTPREAVPAVERSWRTRRVDELPVWLISCFYIRKGHRRQGITALLIQQPWIGRVPPGCRQSRPIRWTARSHQVRRARGTHQPSPQLASARSRADPPNGRSCG